MKKLLFVYGTLMRGFRNHVLFSEITHRYIDEAYTFGRLFHLKQGNYPAMTEGSDRIKGELYEIDDFHKNIDQFDILENYMPLQPDNSEYMRRLTSVFVGNNKPLNAYAYFYNCIDNAEFSGHNVLIPEGCWKSFKKIRI